MKKSILFGSVGLAILAMQASAQTLVINGETVTGVTVQSFDFSGSQNRLTILTAGNESIGIIGEGGTTPPPDPVEPPPVDPDPVDPVDPGSCVDDATRVCGYNINWASNSGASVSITIPRGKTVVSTFTTTSSTRREGGIQYQTPTAGARPLTNVWISRSPDPTAPHEPGCRMNNRSFIYTLAWYQFYYFGLCELAPNTTYYSHIQHADPNQSSTVINRSMRTNSL